MGCFGGREKGPPEYTAKWDFMTLSDFRCTSAWTGAAYGWLWFMAVVSIAVYAVDTFTAVNLLIFNKWSSEVQPALAFKYSRWIFAGCILLSWVLCFYEWMRAIRVIRRGGVAQSYMDPLAVTLQSMRSQGWKRFLVFSELTKSRKGADYVALFVYFSFQGAVRVVLAEGPRQGINAMTLYAVLQSEILGPTKDNHSPAAQFFLNIQALADQNKQQAVVYFSMLFTLVIWVFSALSLIISAVLYLVFLWHYIPQRDGRLSIYCRRKVDRRLEKIVEHKVKAALEEEERQKRKADRKAESKRQKTGDSSTDLPPPKLVRQPTLPQVSDEKLPEFPLARQATSNTVSTLPPYSSRSSTRSGSYESQREPTLPDTGLNTRPDMQPRSGTNASGWSNASYASAAPLLANAGYAGEPQNAPAVPPSAFSRQGSFNSYHDPMQARTMSQNTHGSQRPYSPMSRMDTQGSSRPYAPVSRDGSQYGRPPRIPLPVRSNTAYSFDQGQAPGRSPHDPPFPSPSRQNTADPFSRPLVRQHDDTSPYSEPPSALSRQPTFGTLHSQQSFSRPVAGRQPSHASSFQQSFGSVPAQVPRTQSPQSYEMTHQPPRSASTQPPGNGYVAFNPSRLNSVSSASPPEQRRNITVAGTPGTDGNYFGQVQEAPQRSATAPIDDRNTMGYADILDDYSSTEPPQESFRRPSPPGAGMPRAATAQPRWQEGPRY